MSFFRKLASKKNSKGVIGDSSDKSSDCTLASGGAVANGFTTEALGAAEGFEAFDVIFCFGGAGASSESASSAD